jgi:hypothetical protein
MLYRLGSLTHGLSELEMKTGTVPVGWHGIYRSPLYLPVTVLRSIVFKLFLHHGQTLTRLPNAILGAITVVSFTWLSWIWHGRRTALLMFVLVSCNAWVLHTSRFASNDIVFLWAGTTLLLCHALLHRLIDHIYRWFFTLLLLGLLLTVPGLIWLVLIELWLSRAQLIGGLQRFGSFWQRLLAVFLFILWLPLLILNARRPGQLKLWLGFPEHFAHFTHIIKDTVAVGVHLFIRGPQYPWLWLGRAPLFDIFSLAMALIGLYFYLTHWRSARSLLLILIFIVGTILIGLGGAVSLSLLVPTVFALIAMGLSFLLHRWLQTFPHNPLARQLGIWLVILAVIASCVYNLRAYFVAWADSPKTQGIFRYHR